MRLFPASILTVWTLILFLCINTTAFAQCANGEASRYITYDTTVSGSGNNDFFFTFPQFDPSLGTSVSVRMDTYLTLKYSFELENNNHSGSDHTVQVVREDVFSYPTGNIDKIDKRKLGPYPLQGSDGVPGSGTDYVKDGPLLAFQNFHNVYNITNDVVPFLGNGTITINYSTSSYANVVGNLNSTLTGSAVDNIIFKLTYFYCPMASLPADLTDFTARRETSGNIMLRWYSPNEYAGKKFEIEKSIDGRKFEIVHEMVSMTSTGTHYEHIYKPAKEDRTKVFFRVKEFEADESFKYSAVRDVSLPYTDSKMKVYPTTPLNTIQVFFPLAVKADYEVRLISLMGQIMQKEDFYRTNLLRMNFNRHYPPGTYIVYVINKQSQESQQSKIVIL